MNQREQQEAVADFRKGIYNVLCCTCIGEEGLDIGQVDLIINVDSLSSSIRTQQRAGRTGRKRDGRVVYLLCEGAEKEKYDKSQEKARRINIKLGKIQVRKWRSAARGAAPR